MADPPPRLRGCPEGGAGGKSAARLVLLHPPALAFFYRNFLHSGLNVADWY